MSTEHTKVEAARLEDLWRGEFGDAYVDRNAAAGDNRASFWHQIMTRYPSRRILEVGCNLGGNLRWIAEHVEPQAVYGVDINLKALAQLHELLPAINGIYSPARELPFRDGYFDMAFTMGVLIHQPDDTLPLVMAELVRCSRRYVLCGEYYAEQRTEVPYRGQAGALIKRDFGGIYSALFPQLQLLERGFLGRDLGWDDVTYWVFEKLA